MNLDPNLDLRYGLWLSPGAKRKGRDPWDDPDSESAILQEWHRQLWSKPLPNGRVLNLRPGEGRRLVEDGICWSSDGGAAAYTQWRYPWAKVVTGRYSQEANDAFLSHCYKIGGFIMFPAKARKLNPDDKYGRTINTLRGWEAKIDDRLDLTLECVRRHYAGINHPLAWLFAAEAEFFDLFVDFEGYVDFWLLQDLVNPDGTIRWWAPFDGFQTRGFKLVAPVYDEYRHRLAEFVSARGARMQRWVEAQPTAPTHL